MRLWLVISLGYFFALFKDLQIFTIFMKVSRQYHVYQYVMHALDDICVRPRLGICQYNIRTFHPLFYKKYIHLYTCSNVGQSSVQIVNVEFLYVSCSDIEDQSAWIALSDNNFKKLLHTTVETRFARESEMFSWRIDGGAICYWLRGNCGEKNKREYSIKKVTFFPSFFYYSYFLYNQPIPVALWAKVVPNCGKFYR